jgi:(4S)-4-hydroxy-5-phosphonooxypentane-2,3-dione isomerase
MEVTMHIVVVTVQVKPEYLERYLAVTVAVDARGAVEKEPGCVRFDVLQSDQDPTQVTLYEVYRDDAAFQAHLQSAHFKEWAATVQADWTAGPAQVCHCRNAFPADENW